MSEPLPRLPEPDPPPSMTTGMSSMAGTAARPERRSSKEREGEEAKRRPPPQAAADADVVAVVEDATTEPSPSSAGGGGGGAPGGAGGGGGVVGDGGRGRRNEASARASLLERRRRRRRAGVGNCPGKLRSFLTRYHPSRYLLFNVSDDVSDESIDDRTLLLLRSQIVHLGWTSPGLGKSQTPSLSHLLDACRAMHAYLSLDDDRENGDDAADSVAVVYCSNGKTRTGIVVACYLKYSGLVRTAMDGFRTFCSRRCASDVDVSDVRDLSEQIPPSLKTFFRNFDDCVELGSYPNPRPVLLRAVAIQGVPVDDMPRIDVWDCRQRRVYSSHGPSTSVVVSSKRGSEKTLGKSMSRSTSYTKLSEMGADNTTGTPGREGRRRRGSDLSIVVPPSSAPLAAAGTAEDGGAGEVEATSQWADEEGFYRVNRTLAGDFVLLCRFGGSHASDYDDIDDENNDDERYDPTKVLFRYANHSGFVCPGPYELPKCNVDMMRRYEESFDEDDFLITFLFERVEEDDGRRGIDGDGELLPPILEGEAAIRRGWNVISRRHAARPSAAAREALDGVVASLNGDTDADDDDAAVDGEPPPDVASIALQLNDNDAESAVDDLSPHGGRLRDLVVRRTIAVPPAAGPTTVGLDDDENDAPDLLADSDDNTAKFLVTLDGLDLGVDLGWSSDSESDDDDGDDDDDRGRRPARSDPAARRPGRNKRAAPSSYVDDDVAVPYRTLTTAAPGDVVDALGVPVDFDSGSDSDDVVDPEDFAEELSCVVDMGRRPDLAFHGDRRRKRRRRERRRRERRKRGGIVGDGGGLGGILSSLRSAAADAFGSDDNRGEEEDDDDVLVRSDRRRPPSTGEYFVHSSDDGIRNDVDVDVDEAALEMLLKISHTGVTAKDLIDLRSSSMRWGNDAAKWRRSRADFDDEEGTKRRRSKYEPEEEAAAAAGSSPEEGKKEDPRRAGAGGAGVVVADAGGGGGDVGPAGGSSTVGAAGGGGGRSIGGSDGPPEATSGRAEGKEEAPSRRPVDSAAAGGGGGGAEPTTTTSDADRTAPSTAASAPEGGKKPALKDDPEYQKYFKMLKMGLPMGAVKNAMQRDGKDPEIMDGDPNEPAKVAPPLKEDPEYEKYFRMLKMGLPVGAVKNALQRDGKDPRIMDLDHDKPLKDQKLPEKDGDDDGSDDEEEEDEEEAKKAKAAADDGPPLKDDPEYQKYFKMLKMGLPVGAVKNALQRDGKDPGIMDLDPEKSVKSQTKSDDDDDGPPLKEDPEYQKYFKMLKMGLPVGAVKNALQRDGKDPGIMDLDPEKSIKSQTKQDDEEEDGDDGPPLKDDPEYQKYFKMLKMGLPVGAVKNALQRDGKDPGIMDLDPEKSIKSQTKGGGGGGDDEEEEDAGPPLKEDPEYEKYFKMLKMGLPVGAVKNALQRDGKDPGIMDLDPEKSVASQTKKKKAVDEGPPLKDDPEYQKYFKMLKMGLPVGAVKNALQRDGKDPKIMDLDPEKSLAWHKSGGGGGGGGDGSKKKSKKGGKKKEKKPKIRRKKIYWTPISESKIQKESIWSLIQGQVRMDALKYDTDEFENLFTDKSNPADKKKKESTGSGDKASKPKKSVQVIDAKRGMNGGIILARLKMDYAKLAEMVDHMDAGNFDATQLKALKEFLPTDEEAPALRQYLQNVPPTEEAKKEAMDDLCACEKYMVAMLGVKKASQKFDCMLFRNQFQSRLDEFAEEINTVMDACTEVRTSPKIRKLMAVILTVGNQINTGGSGNVAAGFSLDALLKLDEAKAFDKKTSVLQYLVKLIKMNDPNLVDFKTDIHSVTPAEGIVLDALSSDIKKMSGELEEVKKTVQEEADRLEKASETDDKDEKPCPSDLSEQKTSVREVDGVSHNSQGEDEKGRTTMEKFVLRAESALQDLLARVEKTKETYADVLKYFGEDETMPSNDFFGTINKFVDAFDAALDAVQKIEAAKAKEAKRAAAKKAKEEKKLAERKAKEATTKKSQSNDGSTGRVGAKDAAADMATRDSETGEDKPKSTMATAAAAAALAMRRTKQSEPPGDDAPISQGGIASLAAAAASKKRSSGLPSQDVSRTRSGAVYNVAAKQASTKEEEAASHAKDDVCNPKVADSSNGDARKRSATTVPTAGSIAAMAAAAAAKKQSTERDALPPGAEPADSRKVHHVRSRFRHLHESNVEARSFAANHRNMSVLTEADDHSVEAVAERTASSNGEAGDKGVPAGGIAAMAVAAAAKKNAMKSGTMPPGGGVAAAAAAAAQKRNVSTASETADNLVMDGGIAAMAAAAAQKRNMSAISKTAADGGVDGAPKLTTTKKEAGAEGVPAGGIAAMAAAAAAKKNAMKSETTPPGGGVAAVAAAAAQKRNVSTASETADNLAVDVAAKPALTDGGFAAGSAPAGGIAAMAAAAAAKKNAARSIAAPPGGGIAAMAAAAAQKRNMSAISKTAADGGVDGAPKSVTTEKQKAAAAAKRNASTSGTMPPGGGIAAMAAAAAKKRTVSAASVAADGCVDSASKSAATDSKEGNGVAPSGGIAEMAAGAAAEKNASKNDTMPPGGGIAAMAAAAAQKRKVSAASEAAADGCVDDATKHAARHNALPPGGGIAAMAAAAARKRNTSAVSEAASAAPDFVNDVAKSVSNEREEGDGGGPAAGIAAMAAAAAAKKSASNIGTMPQGGGIAAMAAAAAKKRNVSGATTAGVVDAGAEPTYMDGEEGDGGSTAEPAGGGLESARRGALADDEMPPTRPGATCLEGPDAGSFNESGAMDDVTIREDGEANPARGGGNASGEGSKCKQDQPPSAATTCNAQKATKGEKKDQFMRILESIRRASSSVTECPSDEEQVSGTKEDSGG